MTGAFSPGSRPRRLYVTAAVDDSELEAFMDGAALVDGRGDWADRSAHERGGSSHLATLPTLVQRQDEREGEPEENAGFGAERDGVRHAEGEMSDEAGAETTG